jgi:hypothetical protein
MAMAVVGSCLDVLDLFPTEYGRIRAERFQLLDDTSRVEFRQDGVVKVEIFLRRGSLEPLAWDSAE